MLGIAGHGIAVDVESVDWNVITEDQARARHGLLVAITAELFAGDPAPPVEHLRRCALNQPFFRREQEWAVWDGDTMAGWARLDREYVTSNRELAEFRIEVDPRHRRRGIGSALFETLRAVALDDGRHVLGAVAYEGTVGERFLAHLGARNNQVFRHNRLQIADLDRAMVQQWIERAPERAAGYSLVGWDDPCPEEHLEQFVDVIDVMNTAPIDDLDYEDDVWTVDELRSWQAALQARQHEGWVYCAREDATGRFVGFTEMGFWPWQPDKGQQGDTGVHPDHRDRGLGRWLKAAMLHRLLRERPEVTHVDTGNAGSNRPMLAINVALGFRPHHIGGFWQLKI